MPEKLVSSARKQARTSRSNALEYTPQAQAAIWLLRLLQKQDTIQKQDVINDSNFIHAVEWCVGNLKSLVKSLQEHVKSLSRPGSGLRDAVNELSRSSDDDLSHKFRNVVDDYPRVKQFMLRQISRLLEENAQPTTKSNMPSFIQAFFNLHADAMRICKYAFIVNNNESLRRFLEGCLELDEHDKRPLLAWMLDMPLTRCHAVIRELIQMGILDDSRHSIRLTEKIENAWLEESETLLEEAFCKPLTGDVLPLEQFNVPEEDVRHIHKLFAASDNQPLHLLLYGAPGTGKTTFARSLAQTLGSRIYAVRCEGDDSPSDMRLALIASLRLAERYARAFVLVDEAERLLDTSMSPLGDEASEKAWLNPFLESPGSRIIWITNHVGHLDDSVRRRFAYSLRFPELGKIERLTMWQRLSARHGLQDRFSQADLERLAERYPVQVAVMETALKQAKLLAFSADSPLACVERVLASHIMLQNNGLEMPLPLKSPVGYDLSGVCAARPVEELIKHAKSLDALMRDKGQELEPGMGSCLFYGPPGTGKTALARHLAEALNRQCRTCRASDLLSPYVGVAEQNIAAAFALAEARGEVLLIDEVDSFLQNRASAKHSWEVTQVNEFLTALESARGFCICTTNLRKDMDAAAMRRFSFKLEFCYAGPSQLRALYCHVLEPLVGKSPGEALLARLCSQKALTPGDFHAVRKQYRLKPMGSFGHEELLDSLLAEQRMKLESTARSVGFSC